MGKKVSNRQLLDSAALTATKTNVESKPRFTAYCDGAFINPIAKPFLVHIRGAQVPFSSSLEPYWYLQKKIRRVR